MQEALAHIWPGLAAYLAGSKNPLLAIVGPTAGGKTAFSIVLAQHIADQTDRPCEIINADSRQLYTGMDIGTAKVTATEMCGVPHHLLDVLHPDAEATAGWYQKAARGVIADLHARGGIPILVGGSMLYISTVIDDLTLAPPTDPAMRSALLAAYEHDGGITLHRRLRQMDPEVAKGIHVRNKPRLVRAVEICELCGEPVSAAVPRHELRQGNQTPYIIGISRTRVHLHERITLRVHDMFVAGWIDEVRQLLQNGYTTEHPGLKSHGYRDIAQFLQQGSTASLDILQEHIAAKTRQYARRQLSWWRHDPRIQWLTLPLIPSRD